LEWVFDEEFVVLTRVPSWYSFLLRYASILLVAQENLLSMKSKLNWLFTITVLTLLSTALFLRTSNAARIHSQQNDRSFGFKLYDAILTAADGARGTLQVKLRPFNGRTTGSDPGQNASWQILPETTARLTFNLQPNKWDGLTVEFDRPLTIKLLVDTPASATLQVGKITYKENGDVKDIYQPGVKSPTTEFVRNHQQVPTSLGFYSEALNQLRIIPNITSLLTSQIDAGPLKFDSVELLENTPDTLVVNERQGTQLPMGISNSKGCDFDSLNLAGTPSLSFSALFFKASTKTFTAEVNRFSTNVSDLCLAGGDTVLRLRPSQQIEISRLRFGQSTATTPFLSLQTGTIDSVLTSGSSLALTQSGETQSVINPIDAATLNANGLGFEVKENGTKILSLASARINLGNATGVLAPDANNRFLFRTPSAVVVIASAEWSSKAPPRVQGDLSAMPSISITSGMLYFNSSNKLAIQSGSAETGPLTIDTAKPVPLFGTILPKDLLLGETSVIGSVNRLALETKGGTLIPDSSNRLIFVSDNVGLNGEVRFTIPNTKGKIDFQNNVGVVVNSGSIEVVLKRPPGASLAGELKGSLSLDSGRIPLGNNASAGIRTGKLDFDKLTFSDANGLNGMLTGLALGLDDSDTSLSSSLHVSPSDYADIDEVPTSSLPLITNSGLKGPLRINMHFTKGEARMAGGAFFQLGMGTLDGDILAADDAAVGGKVRLITDVSGGAVTLDAATTLKLTLGSKISTDYLDLNQDGSLSGTIPGAHFQLEPGLTLTAVRGRKLIIAAGSSFVERDGFPLSFSTEENSPTGQGQLVAKFSDLSYSNSPVTLRSGEVRALLSRSSKQPLEWQNPTVTEQSEWKNPIISGEQIGSYRSLAEMPDDEYSVAARWSSGAIKSVKAPNRVMIVNTVPIAANTEATFSTNGLLSHAILARDFTVFGIPLAGGKPVEVDPTNSKVLLGTIGEDTRIEGLLYSKGCLAHLPPSAADHIVPPCERVTNLAFKIKTSNDEFSGAYAPYTNLKLTGDCLHAVSSPEARAHCIESLLQESKDDIWIDIGPKAWRTPFDSKQSLSSNLRIDGDFHTGQEATLTIANPSIGAGDSCSALEGAPDVPLFSGDIVGLRVEKKGIFVPNVCGIANGPDSDLGLLGDPFGITDPTEIVRNLQAALRIYNLEGPEAARNNLRHVSDELENRKHEFENAITLIDSFLSVQGELERLSGLLVSKQKELGGVVCDLLTCPQVCIGGGRWRKCTPAPPTCSAKNACHKLSDEIAGLTRQVTERANWLNDHLEAYKAAIIVKGVKAGLDAQVLLLTGQITAYETLTKAVQPFADRLQNILDSLKPGDVFPALGQWRPEKITIIVNGKVFKDFTINKTLRQGDSSWQSGRNEVRALSPAEYFANGLRVNIGQTTGTDDYASFINTPAAKQRGFTGWDVNTPDVSEVKQVDVTGVLEHEPGYGLDAGVSFDLRITKIFIDGSPNLLDSVRDDRFIRIEYAFGNDYRFRTWHRGDTLHVVGIPKRDRDKTTFYEIHLTSADDINRISP
jgi:hypothetical protein